jgi:predicted flap endonuclease-1-like 5' DNA nuclease
MANISTDLFPYLFLGAAIGFAAAWLFRNAHWSKRLAGDETRWTAKVDALELDRSTLQSSLDGARARVAEADRQIEILQSDVTARTAALNEIEVHLNATRKELSETGKELLLARDRILELEPLPGQLKERDGEIARLRARLAGLEPLPARLQEKEKKLLELEERFHRDVGQKVSEVAGLKKKIAEFEITTLHLEEKDKNLREANALLQSTVREKQDAVETLTKRVGELEMLTAQLEEKDNRLREVDALLQSAVREKQDAVETLTKRVDELETLTAQLEEKDNRLGEMDALREAAVREKDEQIRILEGRITELEPLLEQLEDKDRMLRELDASLRAATAEKDGQIEAQKKRLAEADDRLRRTLAEKDREIGDLRKHATELDAARRELESRNELIGEQEKRHAAEILEKGILIRELKERILELAPLENRIIERDRSFEALEGRLQSIAGAKDGEISRLKEEIERLQSLTRARGKGASKVAAAGTPRKEPGLKDDLKTIHGIGPVVERILNRMGIRTYRQIARWTRTDIDRVSAKLPAFRDRIRRENWVKQAGEAYRKKYGKRP